MQVKEIFDQAIMLEPGETITIPTTSPGAMNSLRSSLAHQRALWKKATNPEGDVLVLRKTDSEGTRIILERTDVQPAIFKTKTDGTKEILKSSEEITERERIKRLMEEEEEDKEDGI